MDTKKYEAFEKTVELQSLTKAAQELGLTQSGVSHMLSCHRGGAFSCRF